MQTTDLISRIVNLPRYPLDAAAFRSECRQTLNQSGTLVLDGFLQPDAIESIRQEGQSRQHLAYFTDNKHNVYLQPTDAALPERHARNRLVESSKGCITTDQIPAGSLLRTLYDNDAFRAFLCAVLSVDSLHEYADPLSSINLHYASHGQELGWHFDNSSFAITLLIQAPTDGGVFEYVKDLRNADAGDMNFDAVTRVLDGETTPQTLALDAGSLVLFRGRNSLHRVTPVAGERTRMLVVLAYNTQAGVALSESARKTFYGRLN
jgi:hypothetical protein